MRGGRDESACALSGSGVTRESESEGGLAESWLAESLKHGEEVMGGGGEKAETLKWHSTAGLSSLNTRFLQNHGQQNHCFWNHNRARGQVRERATEGWPEGRGSGNDRVK